MDKSVWPAVSRGGCSLVYWFSWPNIVVALGLALLLMCSAIRVVTSALSGLRAAT